jgi:hypothetical protein
MSGGSMTKTYRSVIALLAGVVVIAVAIAPAAVAGKPTIERFDVDRTFLDEGLSEACGVPVTTHIRGHVTLRVFENGTNVTLNTLNFALTAMAGGNSYRFRDVGADHVKVTKDGSEVLSIVGQLPFDFIGVLKINLTTGEVIHEPGHDISGRVEEACAALTA